METPERKRRPFCTRKKKFRSGQAALEAFGKNLQAYEALSKQKDEAPERYAAAVGEADRLRNEYNEKNRAFLDAQAGPPCRNPDGGNRLSRLRLP